MPQIITSKFKGTGCIESLIGGRQENQDSAGYADTPFGLMIVVCDGMGGEKGGKQASTIAVDTIITEVSEATADMLPLPTIQRAIRIANSKIFEEGQKEEYKGMGTTLTTLLLTDDVAIVVHVGDSRIYQLRKGGKYFRTFDHSMVFDMVKANMMSEEQARLSDRSNIILKALGISETVEPDINITPYRKGDRFVLCTDGFWSAFDEKTLIRKLSRKKRPESMLDSLSEEIDITGKRNGSNHDNLTAAVFDIGKDSTLNTKGKNKFIKPFLYIILFLSLCLNIYGIKTLMAIGHIKGELYKLHKDLEDAQEELTARKVEKILEKTENAIFPTDKIDTPDKTKNTPEP